MIVSEICIKIAEDNMSVLDFSNSRGFKAVLGFETLEAAIGVYSYFKDLYQKDFNIRLHKEAHALLVEATNNTVASIEKKDFGYLITFTKL